MENTEHSLGTRGHRDFQTTIRTLVPPCFLPEPIEVSRDPQGNEQYWCCASNPGITEWHRAGAGLLGT